VLVSTLYHVVDSTAQSMLIEPDLFHKAVQSSDVPEMLLVFEDEAILCDDLIAWWELPLFRCCSSSSSIGANRKQNYAA
jgi:hypothetical protein